MNEPLHSYLTTTASITTQWFFFACTINVAIAVLVANSPSKTDKFKFTASLLATILGVADCVLASFYLCIPGYYFFSYLCAENRTYHLMATLTIWSFIATALAVQLFLIGYLWLRASFRHPEDVSTAIQIVKIDFKSAFTRLLASCRNRRGNSDNT